MPETSTEPVVLAIDQGTTNSKAVLVGADGRLISSGSAPLGVSSPQPGWVEQDAERIWNSVLEAMAACLEGAPDAEIVGIALSTQRESVVGWRAGSGSPSVRRDPGGALQLGRHAPGPHAAVRRAGPDARLRLAHARRRDRFRFRAVAFRERRRQGGDFAHRVIDSAAAETSRAQPPNFRATGFAGLLPYLRA